MKHEGLSDSEIHNALRELPVWSYANDCLSATYTFKDFKRAFAFMTAVAGEAERLGHHPKWTNVYNRIDITLATHDAGDRVTARDTALAQAINTLAKQFTGS